MTDIDRTIHNIYFADDSKTVRNMVSYVLEKAGYNLFDFEDGQQLLDALENRSVDNQPSVILLDYNMPHVDGYEACYRIKKYLPNLKAPIVFFTSDNQKKHKAMEAGADEFILKPFEPLKLIERMDYWAKRETQWTTERMKIKSSDRPLAIVADDSKNFRRLVSLALENYGYKVESYENGMDLLADLKGKKPSIIILDMEMPRMGGLETCDKIRKDFFFIKCPVLFFTSNSSEELVAKAKEVGGNDFVSKTLPPKVLIERVQHWTKAKAKKSA